jgi:type VI secretion system protein ImpK
MYICLALGFQGRYRIADRGQEKLTQIRDWLMQLIHKQRGSSERLLSPHWQGVVTKKKNVINTIPLWVFVALASVLLLAVFMGFLFALNASVSPLKKEISSLSIPQVKVAPKPDELATLRQLFQTEIAAQFIDIREKNGRSLIELRGIKGLFASGSDQVIKKRIKLIEKISDVLISKQFVQHKLNIVGHTDNIAMKNPIRFADNDALSKARAESIAKLLVSKNPSIADRQRILSDGKADYEPIDTANTKEARQKNRRVEIILQ